MVAHNGVLNIGSQHHKKRISLANAAPFGAKCGNNAVPEEAGVAHFRVYCCDHSGAILKGEDVEADDLAMAIELGRVLCTAYAGIEIWQQTTLVYSGLSNGA
jgi:hypothetical protein